MPNESEYFIRSQRQIVNNLQTLIKQKVLCTISFGEKSSFITTLLDIDAKNNILLFDIAPTAYLNRQLPDATQVNFRAEMAGIKIAFTGKKVKKTKFKGQDTFAMPIPESLFWRQRRQFYRVKSPLSKHNMVRIGGEDGKFYDFQIHDMSISGFSFIAEPDTPLNLLAVDREFPTAQLILEGGVEEKVTFRIQNVVAFNPNKPDKVKRVGCQLTSIPPALESKIQKMMQQIERETRMKN